MTVYILWVTKGLKYGENTFPLRAYTDDNVALLNARILASKEDETYCGVHACELKAPLDGNEIHVVSYKKSNVITIDAFSCREAARNYIKGRGDQSKLNVDVISII